MLTRAHTKVVGRYMEESGIGFLLPHNTRIRNHILIPPKAKGGACHGQLSRWRHRLPLGHSGCQGEVEEVRVIIWIRGWRSMLLFAPTVSPGVADEVLREAGALGEEPTEVDKRTASICAMCPSSPLMVRMPATLMMRCGVPCRPTDFSFASRLPMSHIMCP